MKVVDMSKELGLCSADIETLMSLTTDDQSAIFDYLRHLASSMGRRTKYQRYQLRLVAATLIRVLKVEV